MTKDVTFNPYIKQISCLIKNDFGMQDNYDLISNDLYKIYNSLSNDRFNDDFNKYTNSYNELLLNYNTFVEYINNEYNYKYAFGISKLFINIKSNLYLYIKNKYGLKKEISD